MIIHLDDNLQQYPDGSVTCRHCGTTLGQADEPLRDARVRQCAPQDAGPSVRADPRQFTDRQVVLRQSFCPKCLTLLLSEIVPGDEPSYRTRSVAVQA
jgi:hypothetical protein